jgi:hypothetical protein
MDTFNHTEYILNYPDLQEAGINTLKQAWAHYTRFGKSEGRTDCPCVTINTTNVSGKFGTILFYNIVCNYIAKCNNLKIDYSQVAQTKELGIELYSGKNTYTSNKILTDKNIDSIIQNENVFSQNIIIHGTFKTSVVADFIKKFILKSKVKIYNSNTYRQRYSNNNDLFIHVRLDGIANSNDFEPFEYYDLAISKITFFENGYISSDSITHPICTKLIRKYNLNVIELDETGVIQFGSTCKWIVLSKSTFSWFIGVFAFYSNIYYPQRLGKNSKHSDIFAFRDWNKVNY